jgi:hypothetical protein
VGMRNPQYTLARPSITVDIRTEKIPDISLEIFRPVSLHFVFVLVQWALSSDASFAD